MRNRGRIETEAEVTAVFRKFIAAQNAHDIAIVGEIILDSPEFLWITVGIPVRGREAALLQFKEKYRGTWLLEPKYEKIRVISLSENVAQLFAPAVFTIAPPTQTAQPKSFLIIQIYLMTAQGWKISTILPLPVD
jgi:hypothetical protein